ncbi:hypothetical protein TNCV_472161 [Trichonephila clavipes]|nr:hypothetical protein TNCV_472161 [Trichonephila clavipes]
MISVQHLLDHHYRIWKSGSDRVRVSLHPFFNPTLGFQFCKKLDPEKGGSGHQDWNVVALSPNISLDLSSMSLDPSSMSLDLSRISLDLSRMSLDLSSMSLDTRVKTIFGRPLFHWTCPAFHLRMTPVSIGRYVVKIPLKGDPNCLGNSRGIALKRLNALWEDNKHDRVKTYEPQKFTYGMTRAPYLERRTLKQLSYNEENKFPTAVPVLQSNFYMDNGLCGAETLEEANELQHQLIAI